MQNIIGPYQQWTNETNMKIVWVAFPFKSQGTNEFHPIIHMGQDDLKGLTVTTNSIQIPPQKDKTEYRTWFVHFPRIIWTIKNV